MKGTFFIICALLGLLLGFIPAKDSVAQNAIKYKWEQVYYSTLNNEKSLLFSHEMLNSKLAFADIDGDGDLDIFVGQENGELAFFENQGTATTPQFELITQQYKAIFEVKRGGQKVKIRNVINVKGRSAPSLIDIDNDGDYDLFIGSQDGRIWHFNNIGNNLIPTFQLETPKFMGINLGQNSVPLFADVNLQRKYDLLVGTVNGTVWLYINEGTRSKPDFRSSPPKKVVEFGLETHAAPGLFDWDEDGDLDLVVGQKNGSLSLYLNEGTKFSPNWVLKEQNFQLIDIGGESAPSCVDIDGDGSSDMVIGSANPTVFLYQNRVTNNRRILWNLSTNLFNFNKLIITGNRASITAGDLDGDGDLDLIVGERAGNLNHFQNEGTAEKPNWVLKSEELIFMTGRENSAPALGDLDGDGDLDLLIGEKEGKIALIVNEGTSKVAKWILRDKSYYQIDVGSNSVPRLLDIDGDKDLDLMIGNFAGRIILYLNKGSAKEPKFVLESTRFASAKVQRNAVPTLFDWNNDKFPDLILGSSEGRIQLLLSPGNVTDENGTWLLDESALFPFNVYSLSHPLMEDFNGDGKPDLLLGNNSGDFLLYLNKGTEGVVETAAVEVDNSIDQTEGSLIVQEVEAPVELEIEEPAAQTDEDEEGGSEEELTFEEDTIKKIKIDPKYVRVFPNLIQNETIFRSIPTFGDLDLDGDLDLLIGSQNGPIFYYENQGSETKWNFRFVSSNYVDVNNLKNTAPLLTDIDQDGDLDLIIGSKNGRLWLYRNQGSAEEANFVLEAESFNNIWLTMNAKPSSADLNGDELQDLLVGNFHGKLVYIRNDSNQFSIIRRDYEGLDVGISSTPHFADLNNSGTNELIIGSDAGPIFILQKEDKSPTGPWTTNMKFLENLSFPRGTSPVAVDLDKDGDLDLVTGSEDGGIILYRNDAILREESPTLTIENE